MTEEIEFYVINDEETIYSGSLTTTEQERKNGKVVVRDLRIKLSQDVKSVFANLIYKEVVTLIINGKQIDFYKSISDQQSYLLTTHP